MMLPPLTPKALVPKISVRDLAPCPAPRPTMPKAPPMDVVRPLFMNSRLLTSSKSNAVEPCPKAATPAVPPAPSNSPLLEFVVVVVVGPRLKPAPVKLRELVVGKPLFAPSEVGPPNKLLKSVSFLAPLRPGGLVSAEDCNESTPT
jgi:hypothetical protein